MSEKIYFIDDFYNPSGVKELQQLRITNWSSEGSILGKKKIFQRLGFI